MRAPRRTASLAVAMFLFAGIAAAATPSHPAFHHGYRWGAQRLLCTSVKSERRKTDTVAVTFKGRRYWCSRPSVVGTAAQAAVAVRAAYQQKVNPGVGGQYDGFTELTCSGKGAVWKCAYQTAAFAGSATVTFTAKGPVVRWG